MRAKAAGAPLQYLAEHIAKQIQMRKRQRGGVDATNGLFLVGKKTWQG